MRKLLLFGAALAFCTQAHAIDPYELVRPEPVYPTTLPKASAAIIKIVPTVPAGTDLKKTVLYDEPGGLLAAHIHRFRLIAEKGGEVEIRGRCNSACTLIVGHIPRERLCFAEHARLNFHKASNLDGTASMEHTKWLVGWYPRDIRDWIDSRGGIENMPHRGYWSLPATELFKMGYRRCE